MIGCRAEPRQPEPPQRAVPVRKPATEGAPVVERLHAWPKPPGSGPTPRQRNPFVFNVDTDAQATAAAPTLSTEALPELPLPLAQSNVRLLGIAGGDTVDGGRTAILTVGGDLVLAREGETIAGRYRVVSVGEESVDLIDAVGNQPDAARANHGAGPRQRSRSVDSLHRLGG